MISSKKARKAKKKRKFTCLDYRKAVDNNFIICQFCKCWVHKNCNSIKGRLEEEEFKRWTCAQRKQTAEEYPSMELKLELEG